MEWVVGGLVVDPDEPRNSISVLDQNSYSTCKDVPYHVPNYVLYYGLHPQPHGDSGASKGEWLPRTGYMMDRIGKAKSACMVLT